MSLLFTPLPLRSLTLRNRVFVSPMCQYSAEKGIPNDWHLVHLGSRAVGGAGLVIAEATAVSPEGRISLRDLGIWNDEQEAAFQPITRFIKEQGSVAGIQLAHAGRKAVTDLPAIAPSALRFDEKFAVPREMSPQDMEKTLQDFVTATQRSLRAGFEVVELHMAHGYLLNEFLSPLANHRTDEFGGSLENRMRFPLNVVKAVREHWPKHLPLFVRISTTDWTEKGWQPDDSVKFAKELKGLDVDLVDCSSGGNIPHAEIPLKPGYQVPFAEQVRKEAGIATGAVGLITKPKHAEEILQKGQADGVFLARELLRDPYWPLHAAHELGADISWPRQYERAAPSKNPS